MALTVARERLRARRATSAGTAQLFHEAHEGAAHLSFFLNELKSEAERLGPGDFAVEAGAGTGTLAALLAAHSDAAVLATEPAWSTDNPYRLENVHTLWRMKERHRPLAEMLEFATDAEGGLRSVDFGPRVGLARAVGEALPVRTGAAALVYTYNCLEHMRDLPGFFGEAARVLRRGGRLYNSTEPLHFSAQGHHLEDVFPVPWGHLLWEPEELAELAVREAGEGREWTPGVALRPEHLREEVLATLNGAAPGDIRRALLAGPWEVAGWAEVMDSGDERLAREMRLGDALRGVPQEALLVRGLRMRLVRRERGTGLRSALRFSALLRRRARRLLRRG